MNEILIGIDFSINSPAITIKHDNTYKFISFYNSFGKSFEDKKLVKNLEIPNTLRNLEDLEIILYNRVKRTKDYQKDQLNSIIDAENLSTVIINELDKYTNHKLIIGLEGFSFASKGNSAIDLIMYNSFLRKELLKLTKELYIFSPSEIKKIVAKGNANKLEMVKCFYDNTLDDGILSCSPFFNWATENKNLCINKEIIPKPIDDLVDSYFILKKLENYKSSI